MRVTVRFVPHFHRGFFYKDSYITLGCQCHQTVVKKIVPHFVTNSAFVMMINFSAYAIVESGEATNGKSR